MRLFAINFEYIFSNSTSYYRDMNYVLAEDEIHAETIFRNWVKAEDSETIITSLGITELPMIAQVLPNG